MHFRCSATDDGLMMMVMTVVDVGGVMAGWSTRDDSTKLWHSGTCWQYSVLQIVDDGDGDDENDDDDDGAAVAVAQTDSHSVWRVGGNLFHHI